MKILLVMPSGSIHRHKSGSFEKVLRYAPLTLSTLAALVPDDIEAKIRLVDEGVESLDESFDADLVGITAITGASPRAYAIADEAKRRGIPVVLGGVHPTLMPHEAAQHADAVVVGFAEKTWPQLLRDFAGGRMQPFYGPPDAPSLEGLPIPRRDLLRKNAYITVNSVYATRGCPNRCRFCVIPVAWGQKAYFRPVRQVIEEIEALRGRDLVLIDPNLVAQREYAKRLFEALIPLRKKWYGLATTEVTADDEVFKLLVRSGCRGLFIGFESRSQSTLDRIDKGFNPVSRYKDIVNKLHDHGIAIQGAFVLGFDGDDPTVFKRTVELVADLKIDLPRYSVFTPFPGTPVHDDLLAQGRIMDTNWALYDGQHVVFRPQGMTPDRLQEGLHWAWSETYKLTSIIKRIATSRCSLPVNIAANLGYKYYAAKLPEHNKQTLVRQPHGASDEDHTDHARCWPEAG